MAGEPELTRQSRDVEQLLAERGDQLIRAAIALAGSRAEGEDLLQAAIERTLRRPRRIESDLEGYLRRTLYNLAADGWRRRTNWQRKLPLLRTHQAAQLASDDIANVDLRDAMVRLLHQLPPRQRTVIVLRYWEQRSEAEAAALLGCSRGSVKSAASRGLHRLRDLAAPWLAEDQPRPHAATSPAKEQS
ncbi:MAG: sigma-70 family RNA polymerase sigma factor [Streptosporangiaceae bacterium]